MDIIFYLRGDNGAASVVDKYNQTAAVATPTMIRGLAATLRIRLLHIDGTPYTLSQLNYAAWDFMLANDWNTTTAPQIRLQTGITVSEVLVDGITYTQINIPLTETNTTELITALSTNPTVSLGAELVGIPAGESLPGICLQWDMTVRNRRGPAGTGTPTQVGDGQYSSSQVDGLLAGKADKISGTQVTLTDDAQTAINILDKTLARKATIEMYVLHSTGLRDYQSFSIAWFGATAYLQPADSFNCGTFPDCIILDADISGDNVRLLVNVSDAGESLKLVYRVSQLPLEM